MAPRFLRLPSKPNAVQQQTIQRRDPEIPQFSGFLLSNRWHVLGSGPPGTACASPRPPCVPTGICRSRSTARSVAWPNPHPTSTQGSPRTCRWSQSGAAWRRSPGEFARVLEGRARSRGYFRGPRGKLQSGKAPSYPRWGVTAIIQASTNPALP